jgi:hypothetical protein
MTDRPVLAGEDAEQLGVAGTALLILADDASLWRDYRDLIRRARLLAEAKVAPLPRPGDEGAS